MAGHSHSSNIARRKGAVDQKRAKIFSKCSRAIISAVRQGGPDPDMNLKLKYAIELAKAANMPKDNIERVIKKTGADKNDDAFEELIYEGYAGGGIALLTICLTDNRARTASDVKMVFERRGGNLGSPGSVNFLFDKRAILTVESGGRSEEQLLELALEAGADDVRGEGEMATFFAGATDYLAVKAALEKLGLKFLSAEVGYVPQNTVPVTDKDQGRSVLKLIEALEDLDDVQHVYSNYDMPAEWME